MVGRHGYEGGMGSEGKEIRRGLEWADIHPHPPPEDAPRDPRYTLVSGDIRDVVARALAAAGGKNLVITGGSVPRQCVEAGLVDEIVVHLVPVLLGDGLRFYDNPGVERINLDRVSITPVGQLTDFRFRVLH
jgi:dihydrofolate reductase